MSQGPGGAFPATRPSVVRDLGSVDLGLDRDVAIKVTTWSTEVDAVRLRAEASTADARSDVYGLGAVLRDLAGTRYATPADLAADVRRFVDGAAVTAHRETVLERTRRVARTYRTPIALVLAYLAMRGLLLLWS